MEQLFYWQARNNPPLATDVYQRPTMFTGGAAPIFFNRRINQPPAQLPNGKVIKRVLALFFFRRIGDWKRIFIYRRAKRKIVDNCVSGLDFRIFMGLDGMDERRFWEKY